MRFSLQNVNLRFSASRQHLSTMPVAPPLLTPVRVRHEPYSLLRDAKAARDFVTADSVLAVGDQPHCREPLIEADRRILEYGTDLEAKLLFRMLAVAAIEPRFLKVGDLLRIAVRTANLTV